MKHSCSKKPPHSPLLSLFLGLLCLLAWPGADFADAGLHAQAGVVGGTVLDENTLEPLPGAQVVVEGTDLGSLTNSDGRFLIQGVSGTEVTIRVVMMGYGSQTVEARVGATDLRILLGQTALELDELVVTGTAGDTRRRVLGNAVSQVSGADAATLPIDNVSSLLNGRANGVVVQQGSGVAGTSSEIRIRGRSSLRSVNDAPLIYVDGIRVNNRLTGGFGDPATSRLDDIDPSSIESIEIIKGPAAATLYGTEASNGVIQIITKKGTGGPARWSFTMRQGIGYFNDAADRLEQNYATTSSGEVISANMVELEEARGTPIFSTAHNQFYNLSVSGGSGDIQYYLSGSGTFDQGVTPDNDGHKFNTSLNLSASPASNLTISTNTGIVVSRYRLPMMGNAGVLPSLQRGSPLTLNDARRGWQTAPPETLYRAYSYNQDVNRVTGGIKVEHSPLEWFTHRFTAGLDFTDQQLTDYTPRLGEQDAQFFSPDFSAGSKAVDREAVLQTTLEYTGTVSLPVTDDLTSNTSGGFQVYQKSIEFMEAEGQGFPATGVKTIAGAGTYQRGRDDFVENNTVGFFLQEQVGWKDRLFFTAAIRADDNSAFGENFDLVYYPKVSGSWVVSEEEFWNVDWMNSLRFRGAYGETGQQPDAFAAIRTFRARPDPSGSAAVTPQAAGNPDLGPERGKEIEVGFDLGMFQDRVGVVFTYYNQKTTDAILSRNVAPSSGFAGTQFVNVGEVANSGFEIGVDALVIDGQNVDWDLGLSFNTNDNEVTELGIDGWLDIGWTTRHQEGYPVGSFFAAKVLSADLGPDGTAINLMCADGEGGSISCDDAPWVYLGQPGPDYEGSVNSTLTLFDRVRIRGLVDFQVGQSKYVTDRWNRCAWRQNCEINHYPERFDPRSVAAAQNGGWNEFDWWIQDSSFARFRELSVEYTLPAVWAARLGASSGRISLGARNLGVWTDYPGLDPEIVDITNTTSEPNDQSILPPLRQFSITVNLGY
ncbi:MAG: SusC/RagA family TonB-linked outer membrane protein [Longimicrobiales bacterium]